MTIEQEILRAHGMCGHVFVSEGQEVICIRAPGDHSHEAAPTMTAEEIRILQRMERYKVEAHTLTEERDKALADVRDARSDFVRR